MCFLVTEQEKQEEQKEESHILSVGVWIYLLPKTVAFPFSLEKKYANAVTNVTD